MAALGPHFDGHSLVVACHQSIQEAPGLLGEALFAFVNGASALDSLTAVPTEADLSDHALEQLGHIVLQRRRGLDELTVKHHRTRSALCRETVNRKSSINDQQSQNIYATFPIVTYDPTFHSHFSGADQVALVSYEDDGKVFCLAGAA